jgi:hypothetical protein
VGNQHDRLSLLAVELVEQIHHQPPGLRIQRAGGLVGQNNVGLLAIALAMATRCFWPPESSLGKCFIRSPIPTISRSSLARFARFTAPMPPYSRGKLHNSGGRGSGDQVEGLEHEAIFRLRISASLLPCMVRISSPLSA